MKQITLTIFAILMITSGQATAAVVQLTDFNSPTGVPIDGLVVAGEYMYFSANGPAGRELYFFDGSAVSIVADLNTTGSELGHSLVPLGDHLFFTSDGLEGIELYRTNGNAVTQFDINPAGDSVRTLLTRHVVEGKIFFEAEGPQGEELYHITETGSPFLYDINSLGDSSPRHLTVIGDKLYFSANDELVGREPFYIDQTGLHLIADVNPAGSSIPSNFTKLNDEVLFSATGPTGSKLYKTDGSAHILLPDPGGDPDFEFPQLLFESEDFVVFRADSAFGNSLPYSSDGETISFLGHTNEGGGRSNPSFNTGLNGEVYFKAVRDDFPTPPHIKTYALYRTDGESLTRFDTSDLENPSVEHAVGVFQDEFLVTILDDTHGTELYTTDGTTLSLLADLNPFGSSNPAGFREVSGILYFSANNGTATLLYQYDGDTVSLVDDLNINANSGVVAPFIFQGETYFTAVAEDGNRELYKVADDAEPFAAQLITGSPASLTQVVDTPASPFDLEFDYQFGTTTGELTVLLDGVLVATLPAPASPTSGFQHHSVLIDGGLLSLTDVELEFLLDGPSGSSIQFDNVVFPGLVNGDFQLGLTGWTAESSGLGSAGVASLLSTNAAIPEPSSIAFCWLLLGFLTARRRLKLQGVMGYTSATA